MQKIKLCRKSTGNFDSKQNHLPTLTQYFVQEFSFPLENPTQMTTWIQLMTPQFVLLRHCGWAPVTPGGLQGVYTLPFRSIHPPTWSIFTLIRQILLAQSCLSSLLHSLSTERSSKDICCLFLFINVFANVQALKNRYSWSTLCCQIDIVERSGNTPGKSNCWHRKGGSYTHFHQSLCSWPQLMPPPRQILHHREHPPAYGQDACRETKQQHYTVLHITGCWNSPQHRASNHDHLNFSATDLTVGLHCDRDVSEQSTHEMTMSWCVLSTSPLGLADVIAKGPVMSMRCTRTVRSGTLIMILSWVPTLL